MEGFEKKAEELASKLKTQIDEALKAQETSVAQKIDSLKVDEIKSNLQEYRELTEKDGKAKQEHIDKLDIEIKKLRENGASFGQATTKVFEKALKEASIVEQIKTNGQTKDIQVKVVGDMVSGAQFPTAALPSDRRAGVVPIIQRSNHLRDLFRVAPYGSPSFEFTKHTGGEGAPTNVPEGGLKPQSDYDFTDNTQAATKIAHHAKISEELLNDVAYMSSFIQEQMVVDLMMVEDTYLLGGGGNIVGLTTNANPTATGNPLAGAIDNAQTLDAITASVAKLALKNYVANAVVMHPTDYYKMLSLKDTANNYVTGGVVVNNGILYVLGLPVVQTTALTAGNLLVGDFRRGAEILQKDGISTRFYDQNEDDPIYNKVTVIVEERIIFPIYYADMFAYGGIAAIKAAIETT